MTPSASDGLTNEERRRIVEEYERTHRPKPEDAAKFAAWLKQKRAEEEYK